MLFLEAVSMKYRSDGGEPIEAVRDVSFRLDENEFVTIVGPSGCGKSTLLKLVAGLLMPTSGRVVFQGNPVTSPRRDVGLVFQQSVLLRWRNVLQNVLLPIEYLRLPVKEWKQTALDLLKLVGLGGFEDKMPHELSGGMQQRVSLARALIYDPKVLLMDEPFGALDALNREIMSSELLRIWETHRKSVLFVTHNVSEAIMLADRVLAMSARPGRVVTEVSVGLPRPRHPEMEFSSEYHRCSQAIREVLFSQ